MQFGHIFMKQTCHGGLLKENDCSLTSELGYGCTRAEKLYRIGPQVFYLDYLWHSDRNPNPNLKTSFLVRFTSCTWVCSLGKLLCYDTGVSPPPNDLVVCVPYGDRVLSFTDSVRFVKS